ncbi:MAG: uracil-DNA glycosylase family protein, partial [Flavobacteriaceae bacterium]
KHCFFWAGRTIITQTLTAPSGAANRAIGSMAAYKAAKAKSPNYSPFEFRVQQYRKVFKPE